MPLISANFVTSTNWSFSNTTPTPFAAASESDSLANTLSSLNFTIWNQAYVASLSIAAAGTSTIDLTSLTNLVAETFTFAHVKSLYVLPSGSNVTIGPGASNPLQWFFDDTTATITIKDGGMFMFSDSGAAVTGTVVSGTHKTLTMTNLTALNTAWNSGTAYVVGNLVSRTSNNYISILNGTNHDPVSSPLYWTIQDVCTLDMVIIGSTT